MKSNIQPLVTVGLPAYKGKYLGEALSSILSQTYSNIEIVIVNDASPENLKDIVFHFKTDKIIYHQNEYNLGKTSIVSNWNKVLNLAKGEYFILASDDDVYEPNFIEEMLILAQKYPNCNIFHSRVKIIDESGNSITYAPTCPEWESGLDFVWHRIVRSRVHMVPDFMCRTEYLKKIGGFVDFPLAWASDDATWFLMAQQNGIAYSSKALFNWRKSILNLSNAFPLETALRSSYEFSQWFQDFEKKIFINDKQSIELLNELKTKSPAHFEVLKGTTFVNYWGKDSNILTIFKLIFVWFHLRNKYQISFNAFGLAFIHITKYAIRNSLRFFRM